jgi:phosphatidylserine/phosphatidylglycerophosphate/cardiolipin synthase-like enzyme
MPAFFSPLENTAAWTLSLVEETTIPDGLRYAGYKFRGVSATQATATNVLCPALSVLRKITDSTGAAVVELQVNPFPIRQLVNLLPWGVPTFYLAFSDASGLVAFDDHETAIGNDVLGTATSVTILCAGQDRVVLDPALWAQQITDAINAVGGNAMPWEPFRQAVSAALNTGNSAPVLLLDHTGQPLTTGDIDITFGATTHHAILAPADHGDLQKTVARMNAADPVTMPINNLWGSGATFDLRPLATQPADAIQLARFEDGLTASGLITVTPLQRHITFTNLFDWFAEQNAIPLAATVSPLPRFTRNNQVTPLVNGPEFFDDLFHRLQAARVPTGGFHLAGWSMFPETELTRRSSSDPADLPITLQEAAQLIGAAGGACRFLPAGFIQLEPSDTIVPTEALVFFLVVGGILTLSSLGVSFARTDGAGAVLLLAGWLGSIVFVSYILDEHGKPLEPNKAADHILGGGISNTLVHLSPYPAQVDDNPNATLSGFPFTTIFSLIRHFGCYHQKFAIVRTGATDFAGYCGGIDLNPDRLDTAHHLNKSPFHDLHARVEGPAVRDLALSFEQRWTRDSHGEAPAFPTPNVADLGSPGADIVQVARTYFRPHGTGASGRRLSFAPDGDRTIANTMIKAIAAAREFIYIEDQYFTPPQTYHDALVQKVTNGEIRKLVIVMPAVSDQFFGEIKRSQLITDLRTADPGRGIVQIGYPRRHYTLADNEIRSSSGKCILGEDMTESAGLDPNIVLGPKERVPTPPFWLTVDGELMWVYDEATDPPPDPSTTRRYKVDRGDATRIVAGGSSPEGAEMREHKAGAAATVVELSGIYVHAKMMIVDDVFLGLGSANLNERGLAHDGEINIFTGPQSLKTAANNPIAALRRKLWAEMLNLPADMSAPLLQDPQAAASLFKRSPFAGNRFVDIDAFPVHLMLGGGSIFSLIGLTLGAPEHIQLFNTVVDPTS